MNGQCSLRFQVDYEVSGDAMCASNVPRRARMTKLRKVITVLANNSPTPACDVIE